MPPSQIEKSHTVSLLDQPIMSTVDVKVEREGGLYECYVPTELIRDSDVPLDQAKLDFLENDYRKMQEDRGGTGQKAPMRLGLVESRDAFDVIDGFHRERTARNLGIATVYATVELLTLEELLDERIRNANMHENLKFSRVAEWMGESWAINPLSDRVKVTSAFTMAHFGRTTLTGARIGITPEEFDECVDWANAKAEIWGSSVTTLYSYLKFADTVAPELVHESRPRKAVKAKDAVAITQSAVGVLSSHLPKKHALQKIVARTAVAKNLSNARMGRLAADVADMSAREAREYVDGIDWDAETSANRTYSYKQDELFRTSLIRGSSAVQPLVDIALATEEVVYTTGLDEFPEHRLDKLMGDLEDTAERILGVLAVVQTKAGLRNLGPDSGPNGAEAASRDIDTFIGLIGQGLETGDFPKIQTDEELAMAEEILEDADVMGSSDKAIITKLRKRVAEFTP